MKYHKNTFEIIIDNFKYEECQSVWALAFAFVAFFGCLGTGFQPVGVCAESKACFTMALLGLVFFLCFGFPNIFIEDYYKNEHEAELNDMSRD